jgi:hypothetical protein
MPVPRRIDAPPADLTGFPAYELRRGQRLWRIHRAGRSPWWFSSDGAGRFDLRQPDGTCYVAGDAVGAFVEVFRQVYIQEVDVRGRLLAALSAPRSFRLADTTRAEARRFGVTLALVGTIDYDATQEWAAAFRRAGFGGIRYRLRHDPTGSLIGFALFGRAGDRRWSGRSTPVPDEVVEEARRRFGVRIVRAALDV